MNYSQILDCDIANGLGVRVTLFVSGCRNHCQGCFNPEALDFNFGRPFTDQTINDLISAVGKPYIKGLSLLGGDPLEPENQEALLPLLRRLKAKMPEKDVWCYTGATLEELQDAQSRWNAGHLEEFMSYVDVLVDGRYVEEQRDLALAFRGSRNQRILHITKR